METGNRSLEEVLKENRKLREVDARRKVYLLEIMMEGSERGGTWCAQHAREALKEQADET